MCNKLIIIQDDLWKAVNSHWNLEHSLSSSGVQQQASSSSDSGTELCAVVAISEIAIWRFRQRGKTERAGAWRMRPAVCPSTAAAARTQDWAKEGDRIPRGCGDSFPLYVADSLSHGILLVHLYLGGAHSFWGPRAVAHLAPPRAGPATQPLSSLARGPAGVIVSTQRTRARVVYAEPCRVAYYMR